MSFRVASIQHGDSSKSHEEENEVVNGSNGQESLSGISSLGSSTLYAINPQYDLRNSKLTPGHEFMANNVLGLEPDPDEDSFSFITSDFPEDVSEENTMISDQQANEADYRKNSRERIC